ncbi:MULTISPECIES: YcjX family protein [unclassified Roseitalea]|uniref:YcjX family protein n=1 Tax=unclassified Roseitalea TaxID=2639107 RepID=UPI00273FA824|nr:MULTISPECIES: YcjX family protein [unclassified Roseitalea]
MAGLTSLGDEALIALDTAAGRANALVNPNVRLGVTGLSRAGKTIFITALVHNLIHGGRLPMFDVVRSGRLARAFLEPQPDHGVPRFAYEDHIKALVDDRVWPESTRSISQLRLTLDYESASGWGRMFSRGNLHVDIVDYPGEWLLDLPLLGKDFTTFSAEALERAGQGRRADVAGEWLAIADAFDPHEEADELRVQQLSDAFRDYLAACRAEGLAMSTLPPGRFLMPGDMEGSPALTFAPLKHVASRARPGSMQAMMARRYEAYKTLVVKPFFRRHITRLDRQIVLIDAMAAINAGSESVADLERALTEILECFRPGAGNLLTSLWRRRIDRILVAATKADHLHHESHDRLERIVERLTERATKRAGLSGASVKTVAMAAVRATREATVTEDGETLPVVVGTPIAGETIGEDTFDGERETAIFPGDLPEDPEQLYAQRAEPGQRFVRMRPPRLETTAEGVTLSLPHIRLDKALQFLLGDRLQ